MLVLSLRLRERGDMGDEDSDKSETSTRRFTLDFRVLLCESDDGEVSAEAGCDERGEPPVRVPLACVESGDRSR